MAVTQSGNVGIGTTAPKATLHNAGDYYGRGHLMLHAYEGDGQSGTAYIQARDDSGTSSIAMQLRTKSGGGLVDVMRLNSNGNVGIGTTSPGYLLHCNGTAGKPGGGSWSNSSDARLKKDIQPLHDSLDRLLDLHGVTFEYIDPKSINELPGRRIGMIAQQVEAVFPDWVDLGQNSYKRVTYRGFEALTVEALRELRDEKDAQIEALREQIDAATAENAELRIRLERLEALIRASDGGQTIGPLR